MLYVEYVISILKFISTVRTWKVIGAHLDKMWPLKARYKYMLSTNRTITLWDTAIERAPGSTLESLCYSAIYSTTPRSRRIWSVENTRFKWMKRILLLDPQPKMLV